MVDGKMKEMETNNCTTSNVCQQGCCPPYMMTGDKMATLTNTSAEAQRLNITLSSLNCLIGAPQHQVLFTFHREQCIKIRVI